jgi:energy-coupling factor transporter ATP-binding protein EcfA2
VELSAVVALPVLAVRENAILRLRGWFEAAEIRYPCLSPLKEAYESVMVKFWDAFDGSGAAVRGSMTPLSTIETATTLFHPMLDATTVEVATVEEERDQQSLAIPCINFCFMWACLGPMAAETADERERRIRVSDWWRHESRRYLKVSYPDEGLVLEYRPEPDTGQLLAWSTFVRDFVMPPPRPAETDSLNSAFVSTARLEALRFVSHLSLQAGRHVTIAGATASGKSRLLQEIIETHPESSGGANTAVVVHAHGCLRLRPQILWEKLVKHLECPSGLTYEPCGHYKRLVCVVDDVDATSPPPFMAHRDECEVLRTSTLGTGSVPAVASASATLHSTAHTLNAAGPLDGTTLAEADFDSGRTSSTIGLIRQMAMEGFIFERDGGSMLTRTRKVHNVTMLMSASMVGGSNKGCVALRPEIARHCTVLSCITPDTTECERLFSTLLATHAMSAQEPRGLLVGRRSVPPTLNTSQPLDPVARERAPWCVPLVRSTIEAHNSLRSKFIPTPDRIAYGFDLRDIATIITSLARLVKPRVATTTVVRCWASLMHAIYALRISSEADLLRFRTVMQDVTRKQFSLNILPRSAALPLWIHPKLLGEDVTFVFQNGIHGGLLYNSKMLEISQTEVLGTEAVSSSGARQKMSTGERNLADDEAAEAVEMPLEPARKEDMAAAELRLLSALHSSYIDCHVRYEGFALHLRAAHLPVLTHLVASLRNRGVRPNPLVIGGSAADVIRLTAQIAGSEVVFADQLTEPGGEERFKSTLVDLIMRAGTREERVIFALALDQCSEAILSPLTSFITAGEISDLLSPDNMVAVSTLTQPRVLAAGLQPSLTNAWRYFKEAMRRNLRVVLYLPPWGPTAKSQLQRLLAYSPSILSCLNVVLWPACSSDDLLAMAQERVSKLAPSPKSAGDLEEYLAPLLTAMHKSVLECVSQPLAYCDMEMLRHVSATDFSLFVKQAAALILAQWRNNEAKIVRMQRGVELTHRAERRVQHLQENRGNLEGVLQEKEAITSRLLAQLGRDVAALRKTKQALALEQQRLDEQKNTAPSREADYQKMLDGLRTLTDHMRRLVASVNDSDIKEMQLLARPPQAVEAVFQAILLLVTEDTLVDESDLAWRTGGKRLCSDVKRFRATLANCERQSIAPERLEDVTATLEDGSLAQWQSEGPAIGRVIEDELQEEPAVAELSAMEQDGSAKTTAMEPPTAKEAAELSEEAEDSSRIGTRKPSLYQPDSAAGDATRRARRMAAQFQDSDHVPAVVSRLYVWAKTAVDLHIYLNERARPLEEEYRAFERSVTR